MGIACNTKVEQGKNTQQSRESTFFDLDSNGQSDIVVLADGYAQRYESERESWVRMFPVPRNVYLVHGHATCSKSAVIGTFSPASGEWVFYAQDGRILNRIVFGYGASDIPVFGDYDGDGAFDLGIRVPETHSFHILTSGSDFKSVIAETFGDKATDIPVVGDYDGDGKSDIAFLRREDRTFYIKNSSATNVDSDLHDGIQRIKMTGVYGDIPLDHVTFSDDQIRNSLFVRSARYSTFIGLSKDTASDIVRFGYSAGDIPALADYDGDGITDPAFIRVSNQRMYILQSSNSRVNRVDLPDNTQKPWLIPMALQSELVRLD